MRVPEANDAMEEEPIYPFGEYKTVINKRNPILSASRKLRS